MWYLVIAALVVVALMALVWRQQQRRHPVAPGRSTSAQTRVNQQGGFWGTYNGGGGG